jgi:hypothetical protein
LDHLTKNYQEGCNRAIRYLDIQVGRFLGSTEFSGVWAYTPDLPDGEGQDWNDALRAGKSPPGPSPGQ